MTLRNVRLRVSAADARPAAVFDDVRDLQLEGVRPAPSPVALQLKDVTNALLDSTRLIGGGCGVVRVSGSRSEGVRVSDSLMKLEFEDHARGGGDPAC